MRRPSGPRTSRTALATAILVGVAGGLGAFALWAGVLQPGRTAIVTVAAATQAPLVGAQLESTATETPLAPTAASPPAPTIIPAPAAPPPAPTFIPAPISIGSAATDTSVVSADASPTVDPSRAMPTSMPAVSATPPAMDNGGLQAEIEAAMQAMVPNGSAELIAANGSLVAKYRATEPRTAASTIKLALLIELFREEEAGNLDLSKTVTIRAKDVVGGTGDLQYQVGRTLSLNELAHQMIIRSDNVAANILVDIIGMANVNATAQENGFPNTFFRRHMLDTAAQAAGIENVTSAEDLAGMTHGIVRDAMISPTVSEKARAFLDERGQIDKDWFGLNLPSGARLSHINGTLAGVRNDVGLITSPEGGSFVLAVCQDHLTNEATAEAAIAKLARHIYDILESV